MHPDTDPSCREQIAEEDANKPEDPADDAADKDPARLKRYWSIITQPKPPQGPEPVGAAMETA